MKNDLFKLFPEQVRPAFFIAMQFQTRVFDLLLIQVSGEMTDALPTLAHQEEILKRVSYQSSILAGTRKAVTILVDTIQSN